MAAIVPTCGAELHVVLKNKNREPTDTLRVVQDILQSDPEAIEEMNGNGWLPLHTGIFWQQPREVIQCLIDAYPEACMVRIRNGWLALHVAALYFAEGEVVQCLIDARPQALQVVDRRGRLPLHISARAPGYPLETVARLAQEYPAALYVANRDGDRPIDLARMRMPKACVDVLETAMMRHPPQRHQRP
jgi:ankyrin repeat protein